MSLAPYTTACTVLALAAGGLVALAGWPAALVAVAALAALVALHGLALRTADSVVAARAAAESAQAAASKALEEATKARGEAHALFQRRQPGL